MEADDKNPDDPNVDFGTVTSWSNVKKLEGALLAAGPSAIASLDSNRVVDAVVNHPVDRPEMAPYDFRRNAIPEVPELAAFRMFTRTVAVIQIENVKYKPPGGDCHGRSSAVGKDVSEQPIHFRAQQRSFANAQRADRQPSLDG
jgi:hypothetical protein